MPKSKKQINKEKKEKNFREELVERMLALTTSGFGLVAALAWNEAIQTFVTDYLQKFYPSQAGIISKFFYAIIITIFAVFVTYQLSKLHARFSRQ